MAIAQRQAGDIKYFLFKNSSGITSLVIRRFVCLEYYINDTLSGYRFHWCAGAIHVKNESERGLSRALQY